MMIEVLGPGCARCSKTAEIIRKAGEQIGLKHGEDFCVNKVEYISQIAARGVMATPAVIIDGVLKMSGKVPSTDQAKEWFSALKKTE
jgi:small redox-active disulfide protein 2